jgi:proteasome lid subunit RPN8/RPN11
MHGMERWMHVAPHIAPALLAQAAAAFPNECCGILLGAGACITAIQPAANIHPRPATHFEIAPAALIAAHRTARGGGPQVIGYYPSHPRGPAAPSATDRALAAGDGRVWAIIGAGEIGWWRDTPLGFTTLSPAPKAG